MLPILVAMTLVSLAAVAGSGLINGTPKQGGGGSKRHTRKRTVKLGKSRKRK